MPTTTQSWKDTWTNGSTTTIRTNKKKLNKTIQLLTVVHELLTLDCSLIHVLQAPHTHLYHNQELDGLGLYVMSSLLIDKMMLGLTPCIASLKLQGCRAWKLRYQTQFPSRTGVLFGMVTPKHNALNDKNPLQNHENFW